MQPSYLPQDQVFTVSQITSFIKEIMEATFSSIQLEGEISNWRPSSAGHIYFTLKDSGAEISAVMFRSSAYYLSFKPKDGDKVKVKGNISVYAQRGQYQIICTKIEPIGSGNILQMLEERKQKLAAEGLFNQENKKEIPFFPNTIGVITSPTGAALRDILQITKRRNPGINIKILPAIVQGQDAAPSIVKMIEIANFYKLCDVLIVGRGGGSLEDLLPFSEESVVRAVAASEIPVISAVGHEIDWALCDYAADKRAATPSAAAELATPLLADLLQSIEYYKNDLYTTIKQQVDNTRLLIKSFNPENMEVRFRNIQQPLLNRFETAQEKIIQNLLDKIKELRIKIENNVTILENASPQTILNRGYSMVTDANGKVIRNSDDINNGEKITIKPACGSFNATVNKD